MRISEILTFLNSTGEGFQFCGNEAAEIYQFSSLQDLMDNSVCWIKNKSYATEQNLGSICSMRSILVVCPFEIPGVNTIITTDPKRVFFSILNNFFATSPTHAISDKAVVLTNRIGENVHIGANSYVCADVTIGDNTIIHPNVSIICPCTIGRDCEIFPGTVIGEDGFGYFLEGEIPKREIHFKGVVIGNSVDIGANSCIDRGLLTDTVIGDNVKIGNLCHVGHNVRIEDNCLIPVGSIICGSAVIGKNAYLAPASVIMNQIKVGCGAKVGINSVAISDVKDGATVFGTPGKTLKVPGK